MPIDPSIALNANAPQPMNPLQTALQVAQYRTANAQGQALQQQLAANRATSRAYQSSIDPATGQLDTNKLSSALAADPDAAYNYADTMKNVQAQKQAQQTYDTGAVKLSGDQIDLANKMNQTIYQRLSTLDPNDPNFSAKILQNGADLISQYHADPAMVISHLQTIPADPAGRAAWLQKGLASVSSTMDNLKAMTPSPTQVDTGGQKQYVDTNPLTNPNIVGTTLQNTLTPSDATSQVPIVQPNGAQGSISKANAAIQQGNGQYVGGSAPGPAAGTAPSPLGNGRYGNSPAAAVPQTAPSAVLQTGLAPGVAQAADVAATGSGTQLVNDQQANAGSGARVYQLQHALSSLQSAGPTGPGTDQKNQIQSFLLAQTPGDLGKYLPGVDAQKIASYDEAKKYLTQYAAAKASALGGGTDSKLATTLSSNASTHISGLAAQDVVKANIGLERLGQAQQDAFSQSGLPPSQYSSWASKWGSTVDPRVFVADQMDPPQVKSMYSKMQPKEQAQFRAQYNWAVQKGYINGAQ